MHTRRGVAGLTHGVEPPPNDQKKKLCNDKELCTSGDWCLSFVAQIRRPLKCENKKTSKAKSHKRWDSS